MIVSTWRHRQSGTAHRLSALLIAGMLVVASAATLIPRAATATEDTTAGTTFVMVFPDEGLATLDPHDNTIGHSVLKLLHIYDRLIHQVPGSGGLVPGLATEWEFVEADVLEMKLREGVVFHDGEPFNAEAVKANIERAQAEATGFVVNDIAAVTGVEVVDDFTVRLRGPDLSDPANTVQWAIIEALLSQNIGMMMSPASLDNPDLALNPVGSGPYKVREFVYGDRTVLERFEDYWDPAAAAVEELIFINQPDAETRLSMVRSGEADLTYILPSQIDRAEGAGLEVTIKPTNNVWHWWINRARVPALQDDRVMTALQMSVDRQGLVDALTFGTGVPTVQIFPPENPAFSPDHPADFYPHDPAAARELLAEAGYPDGVTFTVAVLTDTAYMQTAELVQQMAAEGGFRLELDVGDVAQFGRYFDGDMDSILGPRSRLDPLQLLELSASATGASNPSGMSTDRFMELLDEATRLTGPERIAVIQQASGEAVESHLIPGLFADGVPWVSRPGCVVAFDPPISIFWELRGVSKATPDC
jgi:peptide/nickel transport system substrate-binding protein